MRCSISGSSGANEIPLLVMLFYLFRGVGSSHLSGCLVLALSAPSQGRDLRGRQRQVGSLAGAAHLLNHNTGVLRLAQ
jgi:hypothetical protein